MPPVLVYDVDFSTRSLSPTIDVHRWGDMVIGGSSADTREHGFDDVGLILTATHPTWSPVPGTPAGVSSAVYLVFPPQPHHQIPVNSLPRASRLELRVEFDRPRAAPDVTNVPPSADVTNIPPMAMARRVNLGDGENDLPTATAEPTIPPWAVALRIKAGNENDLPDDALINVTCQFHNTGVRLNDPNKAQDAKTNQSTDLDSPLIYDQWDATQFNLGFAYSGIQAGPLTRTPRKVGDDLGYAVGCGFLEMVNEYDPNFGRKGDRRLFSSAALSRSDQTGIGALGVAVGTINFMGTMSARLKRFSVLAWEPLSILSGADQG